MKLAIMQPYFLPYIGYFQLINSVDEFVIYDNIKYTKKGWINRNRLLLNEQDVLFSLPLKKGSDSLHVVQRELSSNFDREKLINQFKEAYRRAPYFSQTYNLLHSIIINDNNNLFQYILYSVRAICAHLDIKTKIHISSEINIDHALQSQDKVLAFCHALDADTYINTIGGIDLYNKEKFQSQGIDLKFIQTKNFSYPQFKTKFIPFLSIIDILMFNPLQNVQQYISTNYDLK